MIFEKLATSANYIQSIKSSTPEVGVVLGSGLGAFVNSIQDPTVIPYKDIPYFKETKVEGHEGRLILGKVNNVEIVALQGRTHAYEGYPMEEIVFPTRVMGTLGIKNLILTNAAGGVNESYKPGSLVVIKDHINFIGANPLVGKNNAELGPRFPDMTYTYNKDLREAIHQSAKEMGITLSEGVYAAMLGPTYETPAEINMLRTIGADMVGMSTIPEAIAACHMGIKVAGVSCITNMAAGMENVQLSHDDVKEQALKVMSLFCGIIEKSVSKF